MFRQLRPHVGWRGLHGDTRRHAGDPGGAGEVRHCQALEAARGIC